MSKRICTYCGEDRNVKRVSDPNAGYVYLCADCRRETNREYHPRIDLYDQLTAQLNKSNTRITL